MHWKTKQKLEKEARKKHRESIKQAGNGNTKPPEPEHVVQPTIDHVIITHGKWLPAILKPVSTVGFIGGILGKYLTSGFMQGYKP